MASLGFRLFAVSGAEAGDKDATLQWPEEADEDGGLVAEDKALEELLACWTTKGAKKEKEND